MEMSEACQILGVEPGADIAKIRQEYLNLAKIWHPDRFPNDPKLQARAQNEMKRINGAYQFLSSPHSGGRTSPTSSSPAGHGPAHRTTGTSSASGAKTINRRSMPRVGLKFQIAYRIGHTKDTIDAGLTRNLAQLPRSSGRFRQNRAAATT
jgi:DnaJ-class molecular chaperone